MTAVEGIDDAPPMQRLWRATALIPFPWHLQAAPGGESPDGGLPSKLEPVSRIPRVIGATYGDVIIDARAWPDNTSLPDPPPGFQYGALRFTVPSTDTAAVLDRMAPALELVLDDLAFQLQTALSVMQLETLDISPPLVEGEEREMLLLPFPHGYHQWKFAQSTALGSDAVVVVPELRGDFQALSKRTQQALDWYIKGLSAPIDADRFIFLWIALEVLEAEVGIKVNDVYTAACGHQIADCPTCGRSTSRRVAGRSLRALLESIGVDSEVASRMWKMRMLVHGAKSFGPSEMQDLGELLQVLRAAVVALLKPRFGLSHDDPPLIGHGAPAVGAFWLGGRRSLDSHDFG